MGEKYQAKPLSRENIRTMAENFRKILEIENDLYVDVLRLMEMILPSLGLEYEIVPAWELDQEAVTFPEENKICVREDVYYGARSGVGRYRFTIMHEIAHSILHGRNAITLARGDVEVPKYKNPEWQADVFAGAFLIPRELTAGMTAESISKECGVSLRAAKVQVSTYKK